MSCDNPQEDMPDHDEVIHLDSVEELRKQVQRDIEESRKEATYDPTTEFDANTDD